MVTSSRELQVMSIFCSVLLTASAHSVGCNMKVWRFTGSMLLTFSAPFVQILLRAP